MPYSLAALLRTCIAAVFVALLSNAAQAVPSYASQTGQSCVACHAGGQFPELTPYGRLFKLTGYTMGERNNPLAAMVVANNTVTANNADTGSGKPSALDGQSIVDFASVFVAGKVTDNIGGFAQYTNAIHDYQDSNGNWQNHTFADNFDLRYADRSVDTQHDLIWGVTLNNAVTMQDPWNSSPVWGYPYSSTSTGAYGSLPAATQIEGLSQVAGLGAYAYLDKHVYAELSIYRAADGPFSFLSYGSQDGDVNGHTLTYFDGPAVYGRLAYTNEIGAHNFMLGVMALDAKIFPTVNNFVQRDGDSTHYQDLGLDAQYQYLLSPHTFTAHLRAVSEQISDPGQFTYSDGNATLNTLMLKGSYVYRDKYGASLAYKSVTGSPDSTAYASNGATWTANPQNVPDSTVWIPEIFYMPMQNVRLGLQFNYFTKYLGATSNFDGAGRNPGDNNTTYLYLWAAI